MRPGKNAHLTADRPDLIKFSIVDAAAFLQDKVATDTTLLLIKNRIDVIFAIRIGFAQVFKYFRFHFSQGCISLHFGRHQNGIAQKGRGLGFNQLNQRLVLFRRCKCPFGAAHRLFQFHLHINEGLQGRVAKKDGLQHIGFTDNITAALNHHHAGF